MNIKKGDQVKIISGKDKGKTGPILKIFKEENRATVDGINIHKKQARSKTQGKKGEIVHVPRPLPISKMMLVCKNCKKSTRAKFEIEGNLKVRICHRCHAKI